MAERLEAERVLTQEEFLEKIIAACSLETCHPESRGTWSEENPLHGHCGAVTETARRLFGGVIVAGRVRYPDGEVYRHFWNQLPNGEWVDFTQDQFPKGTEIVGRVKIKDRLTDPGTLKRVELLLERVLGGF